MRVKTLKNQKLTPLIPASTQNPTFIPETHQYTITRSEIVYKPISLHCTFSFKSITEIYTTHLSEFSPFPSLSSFCRYLVTIMIVYC